MFNASDPPYVNELRYFIEKDIRFNADAACPITNTIPLRVCSAFGETLFMVRVNHFWQFKYIVSQIIADEIVRRINEQVYSYGPYTLKTIDAADVRIYYPKLLITSSLEYSCALHRDPLFLTYSKIEYTILYKDPATGLVYSHADTLRCYLLITFEKIINFLEAIVGYPV